VSTTPPASSAVPAELAALVDDAALFPPASTPLDTAVRAHLDHRSAPYAALVGPFVVGDTRLPELIEVLDRLPGGAPGPLPVSVVVSGGAGALEPAARWADGSPVLELRSLEVALRDPGDLAGNARRVVAAADLGLDVPVYVEPPPPDDHPAHGWLAALDEVAAAELRLKLRTGGPSADLFPSSGAVAAFLEAALDRELPFKCTAGLHGAVRHRDPETGFEHHGFLNVLLATRAALDGGDVVGVLEERDAAAVAARVRTTGPDALGRARRWFTSFGCCEVCDPLEELLDLGLVTL
jgi:hypothetical protein